MLERCQLIYSSQYLSFFLRAGMASAFLRSVGNLEMNNELLKYDA